MVKGIILSAKKNTKEFRQLVKTLGYEIEKEFIQVGKKTTPFYFGEGKIEEIKEYLDKNEIDTAFVNDSLKPSQWFNLEKTLGIEVYDRIRTILEIFTRRASRKEAMLQVKLAKLQYERPFVRELFHRVKEGERPGFLAGGEYAVDDYYEMIKRQMKKIKEELKRIEKERGIRRTERKDRGFYLVSLAGYTNAGKSSLLHALTGERVMIEGKLFSTLSTKTSRLNARNDLPILITDTVGFIRDLPHWLIDAFHSTLEEISLADVVVLVVDGSESMEEIREKTGASLKEVLSLREKRNIIIALNKIDIVGEEGIKIRKEYLEKKFDLPCVPVSALKRKNIDVLVEHINELLPKKCGMILEIPLNNLNGFFRWIGERGMVKNIIFGDTVRIKLQTSERMKEKIIGKCRKMGGKVIINGN